MCLSPKFPDSKHRGYCTICLEKELDVSVKFGIGTREICSQTGGNLGI